MPSFFAVPLDHLGQQLAGASDKRDALLVLIGSRSFADKHQRRLVIAYAEDNFVAPFVQAAAMAIADCLR